MPNIITFNCEILSDFFIGNASTSNSEMRPSSFEGVLRFWWRAIHPNLSHIDLRKKETEFFGGSYIENGKDHHHKPSYRFLSISQLNMGGEVELDPRGGKGKSKSIEVNQKFEIKLQILNNEEQVKALFFIASALGGVGKRSRRGAGSWKINSIKIVNSEAKLSYDISSIKKYTKKVNENFPFSEKEDEFEIKPDFNDVEYPYIKKVEILENSWKSSFELRRTIMEVSHQTKLQDESDRKRIFEIYLGSTSKPSPILVSIIKKDKEFYPIITSLWCNGNNIGGFSLQDEFKNKILNAEENN